MNIKNSKGQSSIEAVISLSVSVLLVSFITFSIFVTFLKVWVDHHGYEAAICYSSHPPRHKMCRQLFTQALHALWPLGELKINMQKKTV
ncbi:MAG: hypothetical protein KDD40_01235 [Bdellovibrionales bacterium]|nr:hypothetical protein [Bdellovibrionales bacterium]